jgi:hypothetical protein
MADRDIHRVGGSSVENLRLKPREAALKIPGISVVMPPSASAAAQQMRTEFAEIVELVVMSHSVGSTNAELIRSTGFDIIHVPSRRLPNHYRIIHPAGATGFTDENLARLAMAFVDTTGH